MFLFIYDMCRIHLVFILFFLSGLTAVSQPCYLFTGKGRDSGSFFDEKSWSRKGGRGIQGVPQEIKTGSGQYPHSLHIFTPVELKLDLAGPESFEGRLNLIGARLTLMPGHRLSFLALDKDSPGKKPVSLIQGESTITLQKGAMLSFRGEVRINQYRRQDPVPWIMLNDAVLRIEGETTFLAGLVRLKGDSLFMAGVVNFGKYENTGTIDFVSGSKARLRIEKIIFSGDEADYRRLIRSRNILIDGKPARSSDFKEENGILSLAN